jgi:hypothetical protein
MLKTRQAGKKNPLAGGVGFPHMDAVRNQVSAYDWQTTEMPYQPPMENDSRDTSTTGHSIEWDPVDITNTKPPVMKC